jgi:hypothetical protein
MCRPCARARAQSGTTTAADTVIIIRTHPRVRDGRWSRRVGIPPRAVACSTGTATAGSEWQTREWQRVQCAATVRAGQAPPSPAVARGGAVSAGYVGHAGDLTAQLVEKRAGSA